MSLASLTDLRARVGAAAVDVASGPVAPAPLGPDEAWFAAQTNPRCEVKAMHGIIALGWTTFVPFGWKWSRPRRAPSGMHVVRRRPGMPGYVFLVAPTDERGDIRVSEARAVDGVRAMVSQGGRPLRIRTGAIEILRTAEARGAFDFNKEPPRGKLWELSPGDKIRITSGIGEGWIATVRRRSNAQEVEVEDVVFGAKLVVRLDRLVPVDFRFLIRTSR